MGENEGDVMNRQVQPSGPLNARIALFGESPWKTENATGVPFSGESGNLLNSWLFQVGLSREEVYVDNVYPFMPERAWDLDDKLAGVPTDELVWWMRDLHRRIAALENPYVIVPTGNYATYALLGKGKVPARIYKELQMDVSATDAEKKAGISSLRGGIYVYRDLNGREIKVIPTIHPAGVLRNPQWEKRTLNDWQRIQEQSKTYEALTLQRRINFTPTLQDVGDFFAQTMKERRALSIDIETWGGGLSCIGFANSPTNAIVFQTHRKVDRKYWMPYIRALCECDAEKIFQNGLFDTYWLKRGYGIDVHNWLWDTLAMHHTIDPTESHDLAFLTSYYTLIQYYKDEAKDAEEIQKYAREVEALWTYNGMDCCATFEVFERLREVLTDRGLVDFYIKHYRDMFIPLLETMCHGVRVDVEMQKAYAKKLMLECDKLRTDLKEAAGEELYATEKKTKWRKPNKREWKELLAGSDLSLDLIGNEPPKPKYINKEARKRLNYVMTRGEIRDTKEVLKKDFSNIKLQRFFYDKLKVPKQKKRGKVTLDKVALRKIAINFQHKAGEYPAMVLEHRTKKKESNYVKGAWDLDGRIRCEYKLATDMGRLASRRNPMRKGYNLQNVKRGEIRRSFLPDEGCVFVRIDMSADEDRRVKMYTRQPRMVALANTKPWEYDAHTANAADIFSVSEADVTKKQRQMSKTIVHGTEGGMTPKTMSETLLKEGVIMSPKECGKLMKRFFDKNPEIEEHYFEYVKSTFIRDGRLVNTWGREIRFDSEYKLGKLNDEIWKRLYRFLPQSECADNLNQNGFKPAYWWMRVRLSKSPNLQVHDEVAASLPLEHAYEYAKYLVTLLEQPRYYFGNELIVPAEVTVGMNWHEGYEWKKFPSEKEFNNKCREVYYG